MIPRIIISESDKTVVKNFFSLSTLQGINYVLPVLILPFLVRTIGAEKFGLIAFAQAFIQYFIIFTDFGFSLSATREVSIHRDHKLKVGAIFSAVMTVKLLLVAVSFLVMFLTVYFVPKFRNDWLLYFLSFGAVLGNALFPTWFFQGVEKMKYITLVNLFGGIIYAFSIFIFIRGPKDYLLIPVFSSAYFLGTGFVGLRVAFKKFRIKFTLPSYASIRHQVESGWSVFISVIAVNIYTTSRIFAVGLLTNNIVTGFYSIAERIASIIQTFPLASVSQAIYPRLNKIFIRNKKRAVGLMYMVQDATTSSYFLFIPLVIFISPWIVRIICGPGYPEVVIALRLLLFSVFFISANAFKVQFLLICEMQKAYSRIHVAAAAAGLPLIFILIHYFSYLGAALATVIIEAFIYLLTSQVLFYAISRKYKGIYPKSINSI